MGDGQPGPVLVSGTDTGVGKTITTAAVAAAAIAAGHTVAVVKPAQTGDDDDAVKVARLAGVRTVRTLARYGPALAPVAAARVTGKPLLSADRVVSAVKDAALDHDLVLVEGAGGLLVEIAGDGLTMADLAERLDAPVLVVARPALGTLNHTGLVLEALAARGTPARVVLGSWPAAPDLVHRTNLRDLPGELAGVLPEGAGDLDSGTFRRAAPDWLASVLRGRLDITAFRERAGR